jgi:hypothetical protein
MIPETDQECLIPWTQNGIQEFFNVAAVPVNELSLAIAGVHYQSYRDRKVAAAGKEADLLRNTVFQDLDIVLIQVANQFAGTVADGEGEGDKINVGAKGRSLSEKKNAAQNNRCQRS